MMKIWLSTAAVATALVFGSTSSFANKPAAPAAPAAAATQASGEITVEGKVTCGKCDLKKLKSCQSVIVTSASETYLLEGPIAKKEHGKVCTEGKPGKATGTVTEKNGTKTMTVTALTF